MKPNIAIYAGLIAVSLVAAAPAFAQAVPVYPPAASFPSHEAVALVRSTGLEPVTRPVRNGPAYVLHAVNPAGREVRVIVDIRLKRIARVVPLNPRVAAADVPPLPPPYARPPAGIATVPDGNGPAGRVAGLSAGADQDMPYGADPAAPYGPVSGSNALPAAPGRTPSAGATATRSGAPPLPRPRPKLAAVEPAAPASTASAGSPAAASDAAKPAAAGAGTTPPAPLVAAPASEPVYEQYE